MHRLADHLDFELASEWVCFHWDHAFGQGFLIRVSRAGDVVKLSACYRGGYIGPFSVIRRDLSLNQWQQLEHALTTARFWRLAREPWPDRLGLDGARWTIEGARHGARRIVECWCPEDGPFRDSGQLLVDLAGLPLDQVC